MKANAAEDDDHSFNLGRLHLRQVEEVDGMPAELRKVVHEYGYPCVKACLNAGVRQPNRIRQLIREIWEGARQPLQRAHKLDLLDWALMQAGAQISAKRLVRLLADKSLFLVPEQPTAAMVDASMTEVAEFNLRITKREKHERRLRAAIRAALKQFEYQPPKPRTELPSPNPKEN